MTDIIERWKCEDLTGVSFINAVLNKHTYPEHAHDEFVLAVTYSGCCEFKSRNSSHIGNIGSVLSFNPYETHSSTTGNQGHWSYLGAYIDIQKLINSIYSADDIYTNFNSFKRNRVFSDHLSNRLFYLLRSLSNGEKGLFDKEEKFVELVESLMLFADNSVKSEVKRDSRKIGKAINYIHDNYSYSGLSLNDVSSELDISSYRLIRWFKLSCGVTPYRYLVMYRLLNACKMLRLGRSCIDVALACGFYDQSAFTKHFKTSYMTTPADFRRINR